MSPDVETITTIYTQTLQAGMAGIALLMVIVMLIGLAVAFVMARGFNRMIANSGKNEDSSNAAITQLAVALTSSAQHQQTQAQLAQRQTDLLAMLPERLAELIRKPLDDVRAQMENLISRFDDMERRDEKRLDKIEEAFKLSVGEAKLKPNDFKPVIDLIEEWRTIEVQEHRKISDQLQKLIELYPTPPPTEPDDQPGAGKSNRQPLDLDAAKHDATVDGESEAA